MRSSASSCAARPCSPPCAPRRAADRRAGRPRPGGVTLHFHPGRLVRGAPILELLARDRVPSATPDSVFEPAHVGVADRVSALAALAEAGDSDPLDDYLEAHVHGAAGAGAGALVLDPCYRGTPAEAAARRLPCPVEWHGGFSLTTAELRRHPDYRGQKFTDLGASRTSSGSGTTSPDSAVPACGPDHCP